MATQGERRSADRRRAHRRAPGALGLAGVDIIGYRIEAPDGYVGRAADFCVEGESSVVTGILATMRGSERIFVPLTAIERIEPRTRKIYVTPTREEVRRGSRRSARPAAPRS